MVSTASSNRFDTSSIVSSRSFMALSIESSMSPFSFSHSSRNLDCPTLSPSYNSTRARNVSTWLTSALRSDVILFNRAFVSLTSLLRWAASSFKFLHIKANFSSLRCMSFCQYARSCVVCLTWRLCRVDRSDRRLDASRRNMDVRDEKLVACVRGPPMLLPAPPPALFRRWRFRAELAREPRDPIETAEETDCPEEEGMTWGL
mmetsp:Transcript_9965/g.24396  ORF Transcript_9965/g.24396 Transcript_9965/m.24396 type:complete len:203 (-) Transcript_9965:1613-2221(-)